jgi:hypothetical protein
MHLHAVDEGRQHPRLADVLGRDREQVAIENDEIGGLPDLERSGVPLAMIQRGPFDRVGPEQRIERNALRRVPDRSAGTSIASRPTCSPTIGACCTSCRARPTSADGRSAAASSPSSSSGGANRHRPRTARSRRGDGDEHRPALAPVPPEVLRTRSGLALLQAIVAGDLPMPRIADVLPFALSEVNHIKVHPRHRRGRLRIAAGLPQGRDRLVALSPDRRGRPAHHPRTS